MIEIIKTAIKWAKELKFDDDWIEEISKFEYPGELIPYDKKNKVLKEKNDNMLNLVSYLNYCEMFEKNYNKLGVPRQIFLDTLHDIKIWSYRHKEIFEEYGVKEIVWLRHLGSTKMFTIGRLEYKLGRYLFGVRRKNLCFLSRIVEIHIPRGEKITKENLLFSLNEAVKFFEKFFPNYKYNYFTCGSWMLDPNLKEFLPEDSGIIIFQNMFDLVATIPKIDHIRFVFGEKWNKNNIKDFKPQTSLQKNIRDRLLNKEKLSLGLGIICKNNIEKI